MRLGFRELLFLMLLLAMPVASYFFIFSPRNVAIAQVNAENRGKREKLEQLAKLTAGNKDLVAEIEKLTAAVELFEQKLPTQRATEEILKQVTELATKQKLNIKSIRPEKPVAAANYSEVPIKMSIVGDFDGFYSFLLELEKLKRITRMMQMQLKKNVNPQQGQSAQSQMEAEITLSIYFDPAGNDSSTPAKNAAPKTSMEIHSSDSLPQVRHELGKDV